MINFILFYFFTYILTLCGFLLGNSTKEEHKEIKTRVLFFSILLLIVFYILFIKTFWGKWLLISTISLIMILFMIAKYILKSEDMKEFYYIALLASSLIAFWNYFELEIYYVLLIVVSMMFDKSMKKFILRKEVYSFIIFGLIYFFYFLITKI